MSNNRRTWITKVSLAIIAYFYSWHNSKANNLIATLNQPESITQKKSIMDNIKLGAFSLSISVKDLTTSKNFYENIGFTVFAGSMEKNYLIMKNDHAVIGLFQGMFQGNILTFNPGWDANAHNVDPFDDVRDIQHKLKAKGIAIDMEADVKSSGPGSFSLKDPDGNIILVDQHR